MNKTIKNSNSIYLRLKNIALGFDTPANVIEKLLSHYENKADVQKYGLAVKTNETSQNIYLITENMEKGG